MNYYYYFDGESCTSTAWNQNFLYEIESRKQKVLGGNPGWSWASFKKLSLQVSSHFLTMQAESIKFAIIWLGK